MEQNQLKENTVYVVQDGKLIEMDKPKSGFGKTILHWQEDKIVNTEIHYTTKY